MMNILRAAVVLLVVAGGTAHAEALLAEKNGEHEVYVVKDPLLANAVKLHRAALSRYEGLLDDGDRGVQPDLLIVPHGDNPFPGRASQEASRLELLPRALGDVREAERMVELMATRSVFLQGARLLRFSLSQTRAFGEVVCLVVSRPPHQQPTYSPIPKTPALPPLDPKYFR